MQKVLIRYKAFVVALFLLSLTATVESRSEWIRVESGTLAWLRSVYFLNENKGWAVGSAGTFLITADGGITWKQIGKITNDTLRDVYFSDERRGWLLCERDRYSAGAMPVSYFLKTEDAGATWERIDLDGAEDRLVRIFFSKSGTGFGLGEGGAVWELLSDGVTWQRKQLPTRYLILDGQFISDSKRILVGGGGTVLVSDGSGGWVQSDRGPRTKERLNSVFFLNEDTGWIVGSNGCIYATKDRGQNWYEQTSGLKSTLFDVVFSDLQRGFAVGDGGRIIETTDGGHSWQSKVSGVKGVLERIAFAGRTGAAVGHGGLIMRHIPNQ